MPKLYSDALAPVLVPRCWCP